MAVVLFHAFPSLLPGGFIGVDIFFVISGFVIARSYLFALLSEERTLREFYLARFRRLGVLQVAPTRIIKGKHHPTLATVLAASTCRSLLTIYEFTT